MKYLATILLLYASLFSKTLSLLPDEYHNILHLIEKSVRESNESILVVTPSLRHHALEKVLINAAKHLHITLITNAANNKLALYENIETRLLTRPLSLSIVVFDRTLTCNLTVALTKEELQNRFGLFSCEATDAMKPYIELFMRISRPLK